MCHATAKAVLLGIQTGRGSDDQECHPVYQVSLSAELGIHANVLSRWCQVYAEQISKTFNELVNQNGGRTVVSLAEREEAIF